MTQLFASGGQSIGASASASILPVNIQDWFPLGLTGLNSLQSKGLSRVCSSTTAQKHPFFGTQLSLWSNSHICTWLLEKPSVQFSLSAVSDSLWPYGLHHARLPCPSSTPRACSNSCSLIWWSHPTISSCLPLLLLPSIFPISGSFLMSQFFTSGGQSIGAAASASVLPMNSQDWFPLGWTGWISLLS